MGEMKKPLPCDTIPLWTELLSQEAGVFMLIRPDFDNSADDTRDGRSCFASIRPPGKGSLMFIASVMNRAYIAQLYLSRAFLCAE